MSNAAKTHDAQYAAFATRMLAALATEEASIAALNARMTKFAGNGGNSDATIRPGKAV